MPFQGGFLYPPLFVNKSIVNEGSSLTIVNEMANLKKIVFKNDHFVFNFL